MRNSVASRGLGDVYKRLVFIGLTVVFIGLAVVLFGLAFVFFSLGVVVFGLGVVWVLGMGLDAFLLSVTCTTWTTCRPVMIKCSMMIQRLVLPSIFRLRLYFDDSDTAEPVHFSLFD